MHSIKIGVEAILDLTTFTLTGSAMKPIRNAVSKIERLGYQYQVSQPPHKDTILDELEHISGEWLGKRKGKEMKFSLGWFDREYLNTTPILYTQDADGIVTAFANLVDEYQNHELAVDLMRRKNNLPSGVMDFLFANLLLEAQRQGYERFNLGLSGLAGVGESLTDPRLERALHFIYKNIQSNYNYKGLHQFKEKFNPRWSPRYLIYQNLANLPTISIALNELSG